MVSSFSSNSTAAQELAAAVGMSSSSILQPGAAADADDAGLGGGNLDPQFTSAGRGKHGAAAAVEEGADASSSDAEIAAELVGRLLPDPAEAARRILAELGG